MSDFELLPPERSELALTGDMRSLVGGLLGMPSVRGLEDGDLRALTSVLLERMAFARQAGFSFHGQRDMYEILGYNRILTYREYRARYLRGGLAKRVVDAYPVAVWRDGAEVYEDEDPETDTEFEQQWKLFDARLGVWSRFQRTHILASLSTYSVLLIGAPGDLTEELPRGGDQSGILYLQPFSGGGGPGGGDQQDNRSRAMNADCSILQFDTDPKSERFGQPQWYQLKRTTLSSPLLQRPVHWSRVIHAAEGLLGDEVYGTPCLEAVWNLLDDLDKVTGGGAEAFWLRANAGLHVNVDKQLGLPPKTPGKPTAPGMTPDDRSQLRAQAEEMQHQLQRVMVTRGVEVTQLSSSVADFKGPADAIVTQIAGTKGIPKRILVGSEMGQLASGQDKDNWNTQVQDRRTSWAFPGLVKPLVDRLVQYGYLPKPKEFHVEWPVIEDLTEDEKVKLILDMASVNKSQEAVVFTEDEMREKIGLEALDDKVESDQLSETQKAEVATKLAMANKTMGLTIFTDDEIRKISYGFPPLPDSEKVPISAPEKVSTTAPPKLGEDEPLAATLHALEQAIENDDLATIAEIVGLSNPEGHNQYNADGSLPHKDSSAAKSSKAVAASAAAHEASSKANTSGLKADHLEASRAHTAAEAAHRSAMHEFGRSTESGKAAAETARNHAAASDEHFARFKAANNA